MPNKAVTPHWRYRSLFLLLSPLLACHSLWQGYRNKDARLAKQRLGLGLPKRNDRPVWFHMASVGEVNAAYPLIKALRHRHPDIPVVVSTITPTGAENARKKLGSDVEHFYLPLDFNYASRVVVKKIRPRCTIIMETELWPRFYYQCRKQGAPLLIVNGRLSHKTLKRPAWVHEFYRRALQNVSHILARSEKDAAHFRQLGARTDQVSVVGNIKFAHADEESAAPPIALPRPYVLAASTHDDEELQISRAWLDTDLRDAYLLVIVPRHPQRKEAILKQIKPLGSDLAVRSDKDDVTTDTEIYLADTFGELQGFIAGAEIIYMGGSIIPRGGQNMIEVARLGKTALFGPHMDNFEDERDWLLDHDAAIEVDNTEALINTMDALLAQPERLKEIGQRAQQLVNQKADVALRYLDALEAYL